MAYGVYPVKEKNVYPNLFLIVMTYTIKYKWAPIYSLIFYHCEPIYIKKNNKIRIKMHFENLFACLDFRHLKFQLSLNDLQEEFNYKVKN